MLKKQPNKRRSKAGILAEMDKKQSNFSSAYTEIDVKSMIFNSIRKINELSGMPAKGQQFRIVTQASINSFDFISAILANEKIKALTVAFYRIGKKAAIAINEYQDQGLIETVDLLVNDGSPKMAPDSYNLIKSYEAPNWRLKLVNNHTKIILAETDLGNNYVIEGSGNMSKNAKIEQYLFENNQKSYNFHKTWINNI